MPQILNYVTEILVLCYETQSPCLNYKINVLFSFFCYDRKSIRLDSAWKFHLFFCSVWLWCQFCLQDAYSAIQINLICQLMINYSLMLWVSMWLSSSKTWVLLRERYVHAKLWTKFRWFCTASQDCSLEFSPLCNISDIPGLLECSFLALWPESCDLDSSLYVSFLTKVAAYKMKK